MASKSRTLYVGVTNNLCRRVFQHKNDLVGGFTQRYKAHRLVHWESFDDIRTAIAREKEIKGWDRKRRIALIESWNPTWQDLAEHWYDRHLYSPDGETADPSRVRALYSRTRS